MVRQKAQVHRRILLWDRVHELFHYWHVLHKPFAVVMYLFMIVHVAVALVTGYGWVGRLVSRAGLSRREPGPGLSCPGAPPAAQISPGPLSRAHAKLEGSTHCLDCHDPEKGVAADKCLGCHKPLQERVAAGKGLHARPEYRDCKTCHVEHQGVEYELVWWGKAGKKAFDHAQTGHPLAGKHADAVLRAVPQDPLVPRQRDRLRLLPQGRAPRPVRGPGVLLVPHGAGLEAGPRLRPRRRPPGR